MKARVAVVVAAVVCAFATPAFADANSDAKAFEEAWLKAFNAGDVKALSDMYSDQAVMISPDGNVAKGRAELDKALAEAAKSKMDLVLESTEATALGDGSIAVFSKWKTKAGAVKNRPAGGPEGGHLVSTGVILKQGGKWRYLFDHVSGTAPGASEGPHGGRPGALPPPPKSGKK